MLPSITTNSGFLVEQGASAVTECFWVDRPQPAVTDRSPSPSNTVENSSPSPLGGTAPSAVHITFSGALVTTLNITCFPISATHGPSISETVTGCPTHRPSSQVGLISHSSMSCSSQPRDGSPAAARLRSSPPRSILADGPETSPETGAVGQPGMHWLPSGISQLGLHWCAVPVGDGVASKLQPASSNPSPGTEEIVRASSLTAPGPKTTKRPTSWSKLTSSTSLPGARPAVLGRVRRAGGSKAAPAGWMVSTKRGWAPKDGVRGTLSPWTTVIDTTPLFEPSRKVTEPGAISSARPGTSGKLSVPPSVALTARPRSTSSGSRYTGRGRGLSRPGTGTSSTSSTGQGPGRVAVVASTRRCEVPTGTPSSRKAPCSSVRAGRSVPSIETVTPGTGRSVLSSTRPETEVPAGSPAVLPVATKVMKPSSRSPSDASTRLLAVPSRGSRVQRTDARPSRSVSTTWSVCPLSKVPPPLTTSKRTDTSWRRFQPASVTTTLRGSGKGAPAVPTCSPPPSSTRSAGRPGVAVAVSDGSCSTPGEETSTRCEPGPAF